MPDSEFPQWLDKTEVSLFGILTLDNGKQITAQITAFDEESGEISFDVISPNYPHANDGEVHQTIQASRIVSFDPQPRTVQPWPYSDPCRGGSFSLARFVLMATIFLCLIIGSIPLFLSMTKKPYGFQEASAIVYTIFEAFFTFAATGRWRRFLFTCPAVQPQLPRLLWRHLGCLIGLFALQTAALAARPNLPDWWNIPDRKGSTPFELVLMLLCVGLWYAQVYTNRSLLDRAHREFSA
jgi:hypothetical protein